MREAFEIVSLRATSDVPVVFLTAAEDDRPRRRHRCGADDTSPAVPAAELVARVRSILAAPERGRLPRADAPRRRRGRSLDEGRMQVRYYGRALERRDTSSAC